MLNLAIQLVDFIVALILFAVIFSHIFLHYNTYKKVLKTASDSPNHHLFLLS